jgi:glycosyltransferase involved in cell wall biosynthesis
MEVNRVSVAICTWNRARLLDDTLTHLRRLAVPPGVTWEVLVVNNNCTDDTDAVIARHTDHLPVRRLFEPQQGHCPSRNRAVKEATGDLVLWTDDDVWADPNWLAEYVAAARRHPDVAFFGGTIEPNFAAEPPAWITRHLAQIQYVFALCDLGPETRPFRDDEYPIGASFAVRTPLLRQYPFDPNLGRLKNELRGGDEYAVLRQVRAAGHRGLWVGGARVKHYVPAERLTPKYVWQWYRWNGRVNLDIHNGHADWRYLPALLGYWRWRARMLRHAWAKDAAWMNAFIQAAIVRGILDGLKEARARARRGGAVDGAR